MRRSTALLLVTVAALLLGCGGLASRPRPQGGGRADSAPAGAKGPPATLKAEREKLVQDLLDDGTFARITWQGKPVRSVYVTVGPRWRRLSADQQRAFAGVVWARYFDDGEDVPLRSVTFFNERTKLLASYRRDRGMTWED